MQAAVDGPEAERKGHKPTGESRTIPELDFLNDGWQKGRNERSFRPDGPYVGECIVRTGTSAEERYARLQELIRTCPRFAPASEGPTKDPEVLKWLGQLYAIVEQQSLTDTVSLNSAIRNMGTTLHSRSVSEIFVIMHRAVAQAELELPTAARGAFIAVGATFDAMVAITRIMKEVQKGVLFVDPYGDEKILSRFGILLSAGLKVDVLVSAKKAKPSLFPAAEAWVEQYRSVRPLRVRGANGGVLHDRAIVADDRTVWNLSQSFDALANRAAGTITRSEDLIADDQRAAWNEIFDDAERWIGD